MEAGIIGLGGMGKAMAIRLLEAGHHVRVWNRSAGPCQDLEQRGAEVAATPREAIFGTACFSMLADDKAVREIFLDSPTLPVEGTSVIHVNMATISVALATELAGHHAALGIPYVAAPVFGVAEMAANGKLNIVAAGRATLIDAVQPLFDALGQRTWRVGTEPSRANAVKIAGNFMIASAIETVAEASALAQTHGVPSADFLSIMAGGPFDSPIYRHYGQRIAASSYEPVNFKLALGLKDVELALAAADGRLLLPFGDVLRDTFQRAIDQGHCEKDWAAIAEVAKRRNLR